MSIRSQAVLDSARGAQCQARFPGICNGNAETTVWCHLNGHAFGKGAGIKAHDIHGFHGCSSCHAYYDVGHGTKPILTDLELAQMLMGAVCTTLAVLIASGIVTVPQDKPKAQKLPTRKPKGERAKIASNPDRKIPSRPMRRKEQSW